MSILFQGSEFRTRDRCPQTQAKRTSNFLPERYWPDVRSFKGLKPYFFVWQSGYQFSFSRNLFLKIQSRLFRSFFNSVFNTSSLLKKLSFLSCHFMQFFMSFIVVNHFLIGVIIWMSSFIAKWEIKSFNLFLKYSSL